MEAKETLLTRLSSANPGWPVWDELISLVRSLEIEYVEDDFGRYHYFISGNRLAFKEEDPEEPIEWPDWMPAYAKVLYGMKANDFEFAGGYAESFDGSETQQDSVFADGGTDEMMGFPEIDIPDGTYPFQTDQSGVLFHINEQLEIVYAHRDDECFKRVDSLEDFTKKNIEQTLNNKLWTEAYPDIVSEMD